ncbi:hypothetical protein Pfo_013360 [Paulownia fortunei]|nr:hypothetical protein Pfo_013360 [Paulownia fortunei]
MAASIPHQYCSDYSFSTEFCGLPIPAARTDAICEETSHMFNNNIGAINMVPLMKYDINSPVSVASFPEQFGVSDCMAVPQMSESEIGFCDYAVGEYQYQVFESGEECSGLGPNFWSAYPMAAENWAIQGKPATKVEETEVKVGRYSVEERKDRILRYIKKRNQRNFNKTIKYACRKTLADKRVRVRGRFAKNNEPCEEEIVTNSSHDTSYEQNNSFYEDSFQMKYDEDYWLQAAMANLGHLPYLAS